jgi:opacity protein-like surface antigen
MNVLKGALVGAALLVAAGQACAQAQAPAAAATETPLYIGFTVGGAHWRVGCYDTANCDDQSRTLRALAGWTFNKYLAAEVGFHNFNKITSPGFFVKGHAWEGVLVASWPFTEAFSVFGKAGGYRGATENNATPAEATINYEGTYGLGAAYELTRNIGVRLEWQSYMQISGAKVSPKSDIDVISVGAIWRFR